MSSRDTFASGLAAVPELSPRVQSIESPPFHCGAEIELKQEGQKVVLLAWIGKEITGAAFYKKINIAAARRTTRP